MTEVKSILVVKIAAIGDVVMSLPMLGFLRKKYPQATIRWMCGTIAAPLVEATGLVDEVLLVDEKDLFQGGFFRKLRVLFHAWIRTAFRSFDLVLTAHPDPRYKLLTLFSRKKIHRFFQRNKARPLPVPGRYHASEYVRLACEIDEST